VEQIEVKPEEAQQRRMFSIAALPVPPLPRCWFLDKTKNCLIQLQRDRFLRNWRQRTGDEDYPRYPNLIQEFRNEWAFFQTFALEESLGAISVNQCEITYTNNIDLNQAGFATGELGKAIALFAPRKTDGFLPPPEFMGGQARYLLPDGRGRLYVEINPAFRGRDMKLIASMNMTARGAPDGQTDPKLFEWFDFAHEWIVKAFEELTTPAMHQFWKKKP
jgi:hypothetical protein